MTVPSPPEPTGGRPLLRTRIAGIPIQVDVSFVVLVGLLGYLSAERGDWTSILVFVAVGTISIFLHELGHALTVILFGGRPAISLIGFGGITSWLPPRAMRRWELILVSLAGPLVGIAMFPVVLIASAALSPPTGSILDSVLDIAVWTTLGWSILNLVPMLPLDGGQIMRQLIPGDDNVRTRRALMTSVVVAAALAATAFAFGQQFIAMLTLFFILGNILRLREIRAAGGVAAASPGTGVRFVPDVDGPPDPDSAPAGHRLVTALWQGRRDLARDIVASADPPLDDLAAHGAVLALSDDPAERLQGDALLDQECAVRGDPAVYGLRVLSLALRHDWTSLATLFDHVDVNGPHPIGGNVAVRAMQEAWLIGDLDAVGLLAGAALYRVPTRPGAPALAYLAVLATLAQARAGRVDDVPGGGAGTPGSGEPAGPALGEVARGAWGALAGIPGATAFALHACRGVAYGPEGPPSGLDLVAVERPLMRLAAFATARDDLAAAAAG